MAVFTPNSTTLRLGFQTGIDAKANPIIKTRTLNRVKMAALAQDILEVAEALASLQEYPLTSIKKIDTQTVSA